MQYEQLSGELRDAVDEAEAAVSSFATSLLAVEAQTDPGMVQDLMQRAARLADGAQTACRELELELKGAAPDEQALFRGECATLTRRLKQQQGTLEFLRRTHLREALLKGAVGHIGIDADKTSPSALIAMGLQVQLESQLAVTRMTQMVESSKQAGLQTLGAMDAQRGQLLRVRDTAGAQQAQFELAEQELKGIAQGALGDYVTQVLLALILLMVCLLFFLRLSLSPGQQQEMNVGWKDGWRTTVLPPLSLLPR